LIAHSYFTQDEFLSESVNTIIKTKKGLQTVALMVFDQTLAQFDRFGQPILVIMNISTEL